VGGYGWRSWPGSGKAEEIQKPRFERTCFLNLQYVNMMSSNDLDGTFATVIEELAELHHRPVDAFTDPKDITCIEIASHTVSPRLR
jgi:hypothetical protein